MSLVAYRQQKVTLPPLLQWLPWERNCVRTRGSVSRVSWIVSGAVALSIVVDDFMKGCYALTA
jgi:hypothetical protein